MDRDDAVWLMSRRPRFPAVVLRLLSSQARLCHLVSLIPCLVDWHIASVIQYTGWSKSLCSPDDYSTSSGAQRLFDHPVFYAAKKRLIKSGLMCFLRLFCIFCLISYVFGAIYIGVVYCECVPMFVTDLSFPLYHEHRDSAVQTKHAVACASRYLSFGIGASDSLSIFYRNEPRCSNSELVTFLSTWPDYGRLITFYENCRQ